MIGLSELETFQGRVIARMRSDDSLSFLYQLKSTALRTDANFLSLVNETTSRTYNFMRIILLMVRIRKLDRLLFQVEKNGMLRDVLAGIIEAPINSARLVAKLSLSLRSDSVPPYDFENIFYAHRSIADGAQCLESLIALLLDGVTASGLEFAYNALVSAVVLSIVFQYLIGYVDRGGTKTYNPGSLEFRATYVSLLLFRGAYVWIKFRDVASKRTVYRRSRKDENGGFQYYGKYEPRFKPSRERDVVTGRALKFDYLPLGGYDTHQDAEVVCQIAGFYYGKDEGGVDFEDGSHFSIPPMSEQERSLCGGEKRKWVRVKVKEVFKEFNKERAARRSNTLSEDTGEQVDARGFSSSADQAAVVAFSTLTAGSDDEFVNFLLGPTADDGPMMNLDPEILLNVDDVMDSFEEGSEGIPSTQERLNQQLSLQKEQLEAEFNQRIAEQQQQHLQIQQRLEEQNLELRQENEQMKTIIHQVLKPLRSHFATSTEV